jgi:hypothetical protein
MPGTLELGKATNEWGEAGFMIFTIKPTPMPSQERSFQWEIDEATVGASLKAVADNFSVGGAGLVFQEEIIFE